MRRHLVRAAAAATVVLCLLATAIPAAANPFAVDVSGGEFSDYYGLVAIPLAGEPGPCPAKPSTLEIEFAGTASSGTFLLTGGWSSQFQFPTSSGFWYQADFTILNLTPPVPQGAYLWSNPPPFPPAPPPYRYSLAATSDLFLQFRIYRIPSCDKTNLACIVTIRVALNGSMTSATPLYTPGGIFLQGTTAHPTVVSSCSPPFSAWSGQALSDISWFMA